MTAEEARIIMGGSMQNKFVFYKSRLTFECGLINKAIDKEARVGGWHVILESTRAFAKKYFAHMAKLYEDKGFIVAYSLNLNDKKDSPEFHVYWDIAKMSREDMDRFLNTEYQTCLCYKKLGIYTIEAIRSAKKRVVEIRQELFVNDEVALKKRDWYLNDMRMCQLYSDWNRTFIARSICNEMGWNEDHNGRFTTMHNYIDMRDNIVRKGAVSSRNEERLIIPINMRDGSLLCRGKGNPDWNFSAPHGAGRLMSRSEARKSITMEEYKKSMEGVYTTSVDETTIDESPMAYKPMDEIARLIEPTVHIDKRLKARYNYKAGETFYGNGKQ